MGNASGVQTPATVTVRTAVTTAVVEVTPLTAVQTTWRRPMTEAVPLVMEAELFEAVDNARGVQMHSADKRDAHNRAASADGGGEGNNGEAMERGQRQRCADTSHGDGADGSDDSGGGGDTTDSGADDVEEADDGGSAIGDGGGAVRGRRQRQRSADALG